MVRNDAVRRRRLDTMGKGAGKFAICGASTLIATATVMQIIVTEPLLVGATLNSIINR